MRLRVSNLQLLLFLISYCTLVACSPPIRKRVWPWLRYDIYLSSLYQPITLLHLIIILLITTDFRSYPEYDNKFSANQHRENERNHLKSWQHCLRNAARSVIASLREVTEWPLPLHYQVDLFCSLRTHQYLGTRATQSKMSQMKIFLELSKRQIPNKKFGILLFLP